MTNEKFWNLRNNDEETANLLSSFPHVILDGSLEPMDVANCYIVCCEHDDDLNDCQDDLSTCINQMADMCKANRVGYCNDEDCCSYGKYVLVFDNEEDAANALDTCMQDNYCQHRCDGMCEPKCHKDEELLLEDEDDDDFIISLGGEDSYGPLSVYIEGKGDDGEYNDVVINFPVTEEQFDSILERNNIGEDWTINKMVSDEWETLPEVEPYYDDLKELYDNIQDYSWEYVSNVAEVTGDVSSAVEALKNSDAYFHPDLNNWSDVGEYIVNEMFGGFEALDAEDFERYIDTEALGRDLGFDYFENDEGEEISAGMYFCGDDDATDEEIGEQYLEIFTGDKESLKNLGETYFDYDSYGRSWDNVFTFTTDGVVEYEY